MKESIKNFGKKGKQIIDKAKSKISERSKREFLRSLGHEGEHLDKQMIFDFDKFIILKTFKFRKS